jgi:hypothetical protein
MGHGPMKGLRMKLEHLITTVGGDSDAVDNAVAAGAETLPGIFLTVAVGDRASTWLARVKPGSAAECELVGYALDGVDYASLVNSDGERLGDDALLQVYRFEAEAPASSAKQLLMGMAELEAFKGGGDVAILDITESLNAAYASRLTTA